MRKAIKLAVTLWVEGEDEPARDVSSSTIQAIHDIISAGAWRHPRLNGTIKKIEEDTSEDADDAPA